MSRRFGSLVLTLFAMMLSTALQAQAPGADTSALSPGARDNLVAFTRLLGYVRFFHPSDQAAGEDWDAFATRGIPAVESAGSPARLARVLDSLFAPVAPSLRVYAGRAPRATALAAPAGAREVVSWRHLGVGFDTTDEVYRNTRVRVPVGAMPDSLPDPRRPLTVMLGRGVEALLPLAVYADSQGTLPRATVASPTESAPPGPESRSGRLAGIALAWGVYQHFDPYFDVSHADWDAILPVALASAATAGSREAFFQTLQRMVAPLQDGHANPSDPSDTAQRTVRMGVDWIEGRVVITRVDSTERRLHPGDVVLSIDGRPVAERIAALTPLMSAATPQFLHLLVVEQMLHGRAGSEVRLEVAGPDGSRREVTLRRDYRGWNMWETYPPPIAELRPGIFYVDLRRLTDSTWSAAIPTLMAARGIIFDGRGYPGRLRHANRLLGHLFQDTLESAQWWVPVVTRPDRVGLRFTRIAGRHDAPLAPYLAARKVFLINGMAISYAETILGIVEAYRIGDLVGGPTAGTNGNNNMFTIPGGYRMFMTGMRVLKNDGSRHMGVGILPTVPVARTVAGVAAGRDEILERALALFEAGP